MGQEERGNGNIDVHIQRVFFYFILLKRKKKNTPMAKNNHGISG